MLDAFLIFVCGAATMRLLQIILSINPNYYIYKQTEYNVVRILAELHVNKLAVLKVLEVCYRDSDRLNEWAAVENEVNKRYDSIIKDSIVKLKAVIPYKTDYNTIQEAVMQLLKEKIRDKD